MTHSNSVFTRAGNTRDKLQYNTVELKRKKIFKEEIKIAEVSTTNLQNMSLIENVYETTRV